jgi:hypothetical protein
MLLGRPIVNFLTSIGFEFETTRMVHELSGDHTIDQLIHNRFFRNETRKTMPPDKYGILFEYIVEQMLQSRFTFDTLRDVKILGEGSGGDYDVLGFQSPHLIYLECKTGKSLDFANIFQRHSFLRPALTIILIDQEKEFVENRMIQEVQPYLSRRAVRTHTALPETYKQPYEVITNDQRAYKVFATQRNVFLASGEDLQAAVHMCMRYFHQVVSQTSFYSEKIEWAG